jgi:response regulator RpfG family c-di-GMP phosphodiesterase
MSALILWGGLIALVWSLVVAFIAASVGRASRVPLPEPGDGDPVGPEFREKPEERLRILVVDDDPNLRGLLRVTFDTAEVEIEDVDSAAAAAERIAGSAPDVVVLDVSMPGLDGITFCRQLKADPSTRELPVILLTGDPEAELAGRKAGADAFLHKPFSPLELITVAERVAAAPSVRPPILEQPAEGQLLLYAQDFRQLLELERGQRRLLENAYRETVVALAQALDAKDGGTGAHSERVRRYATELSKAVDPSLLDNPGAEYGFILHDVGKIAIPDAVLAKTTALTDSERRLLQSHPLLGEQMVGGAALLRGQGAQVVRSHHERWDGSGYPDRLRGDEIPPAARIFSVADALDAITSDRPYRAARSWSWAVDEIRNEAGRQFDPAVVDVFLDREEAMRRIYYEVSTN